MPKNTKKCLSNGCDQCPDFAWCHFSRSYIPISNRFYEENKSKPIVWFPLVDKFGGRSSSVQRTQPCQNKCNECDKVAQCALQAPGSDLKFPGRLVFDNMPTLCSVQIRSLYQPESWGHQRIVEFYKECVCLGCPSIRGDTEIWERFAKEFPRNASLDYDDGVNNAKQLAQAITDHITNRLIPEYVALKGLIANRIELEKQNKF